MSVRILDLEAFRQSGFSGRSLYCFAFSGLGLGHEGTGLVNMTSLNL